MTLLNPGALLMAAALAPVILLLYLLRLRRRTATVSTLLFWRRVLGEQRRRVLLGRLRRVLSLLLQLLLLTLLVLALARPEITGLFTRGGGASGSGEVATVLVLDCRARMQAREADGRTRFERARGELAAYARRVGPRRPAALLAAGNAPRVLAPLGDDENAVLTALGSARVLDAGGRLEDALGLADELLAARSGEKRILVFTDRPPDPSQISNLKSPLVFLPAADPGGSRENVAITRLAVRPRPDSPQTDEVFLQIANTGARRQRGEVELNLDGRLVDVRPFDLAPGERRTEVYPALAADRALANARGWLHAHLARPKDADPDALPLDDDGYAVLPPRRPVRVLLVSRGNWFLENSLRADDGVEFNLLAPEGFQPAAAGNFDVVVLDDVLLPPTLARPETLPPAGNFLFVRRSPFTSSAVGNGEGETLDRPLVAESDAESPLLRLVDWRQVTVARALALPPVRAGAEAAAGGWRLAAPVRAAADRPLVLSGERRGGAGRGPQRVVALAFGLTDGDLPLRVAFPLFMSNAVRWLAGGGEDDAAAGGGGALRAGETLRLAAGETLWTRSQRGALRPVPAALPAAERVDGPSVFQPLENGFYLRRRPPKPGGAPEGEERWLAVNTGDPEVSALNGPPGARAELPAAPNAAPRAGWWEALWTRPPWVLLALAAGLLSVVEWGWFHRRRTE